MKNSCLFVDSSPAQLRKLKLRFSSAFDYVHFCALTNTAINVKIINEQRFFNKTFVRFLQLSDIYFLCNDTFKYDWVYLAKTRLVLFKFTKQMHHFNQVSNTTKYMYISSN